MEGSQEKDYSFLGKDTFPNLYDARAYSLLRNASISMNSWRQAPKPLIEAVEDVCTDLMDLLGYQKMIIK